MSNNLKRAIRERMAKTDENYTTARRHILAERERDKAADKNDEPARKDGARDYRYIDKED